MAVDLCRKPFRLGMKNQAHLVLTCEFREVICMLILFGATHRVFDSLQTINVFKSPKARKIWPYISDVGSMACS